MRVIRSEINRGHDPTTLQAWELGLEEGTAFVALTPAAAPEQARGVTPRRPAPRGSNHGV